MALKTISNPVNTATDNVSVGTKKLIAEFNSVYDWINTLFRLQAGSEPGSPLDYDVWLDNTGVSPVLRYYKDGWNQLGASGLFEGGVSLDQGMANYSRGMILRRTGTTGVRVVASTTAPATISIGGVLVQATSDVATAGFTGTAGWYDIYAKVSGSTFTLAAGSVNTAFTPGADERVVGRVYWNGSIFDWFHSLENDGMLYERVQGYFHYSLDATAPLQSLASVALKSNNYERVIFNTKVGDMTTNAYSVSTGIFTVAEEGLYQFDASVYLEATAETANVNAEIVIARLTNGTPNIGSGASKRQMAYGVGYVNATVTHVVRCSVGDTFAVYIQQTSSNNGAINIGDANSSMNYFRGRRLGYN